MFAKENIVLVKYFGMSEVKNEIFPIEQTLYRVVIQDS